VRSTVRRTPDIYEAPTRIADRSGCHVRSRPAARMEVTRGACMDWIAVAESTWTVINRQSTLSTTCAAAAEKTTMCPDVEHWFQDSHQLAVEVACSAAIMEGVAEQEDDAAEKFFCLTHSAVFIPYLGVAEVLFRLRRQDQFSGHTLS